MSRKLAGDAAAPVGLLALDEADQDRLRGIEYYVNLLGLRKRVMGMLKDSYMAEHGHEPNKMQLNGHCQKQFGERGLQLALDGAKAKGAPNFYTDEELVVTCFVLSIWKGVEVVLITGDEDLYEQFFKLKDLMVNHYCSMKLAANYADDPLGAHCAGDPRRTPPGEERV